MSTESLETPEFLACSDATRAAADQLLATHDSRLLLSCLLAECSHLAALLRAAGVYSPYTTARLFGDAAATALTLDVKPKVVYTDGGQKIGSKQ